MKTSPPTTQRDDQTSATSAIQPPGDSAPSAITVPDHAATPFSKPDGPILSGVFNVSPDIMLFIAQVLMPAAFIFAFGACFGSLTNVLVYRLPMGLSVVTPPSRCPACETTLTWRENIPIFGWLFLRGRCRFCKSKISAEYPLVELLVAVLFAVFFVLWYGLPDRAMWLDVNWGMIRPEWAAGWGAPAATWPIFAILLLTLGCLVAMTIVDAKTFTIPMELSLTPAVLGLVVHPLWALYIQLTRGTLPSTAPGWPWAIPTPTDWWWIGASLGGGVGVLISLLLLRTGVLRRSFADFEDWEDQQRAAATAKAGGVGGALATPGHPIASDVAKPQGDAALSIAVDKSSSKNPSGGGDGASLSRSDASRGALGTATLALFAVGLLVLLVAGGVLVSQRVIGQAGWIGGLAGLGLGCVGVALMLRFLGPADSAEPNQAEGWMDYPHARREMVSELAFLAPIGLGGFAGGWIAEKFAQVAANQPPIAAPLWLQVFAGAVLGYLVGGGVVWLVRIAGSAAFGREAMGMGDVHLMAGVGACLGWIDVTLAFFAAAFVGLVWTVLSILRYGSARRAMPYGPFLAVAVVLVVLCKPLIESWLSVLLPHLAPINIP